MRGPDRRATRLIADWTYLADDDGEPPHAGIRYESRIRSRWECWAVFDDEDLEIDAAEACGEAIRRRTARRAPGCSERRDRHELQHEGLDLGGLQCPDFRLPARKHRSSALERLSSVRGGYTISIRRRLPAASAIVRIWLSLDVTTTSPPRRTAPSTTVTSTTSSWRHRPASSPTCRA